MRHIKGKLKVILALLVGGALLVTVPTIAEAKGGNARGNARGGGFVFVEYGDTGGASDAPPGYFLWHVKLGSRPWSKQHYLEFIGYDSKGTQVVDITARRKHSENGYFNPWKVTRVQLKYDGQLIADNPNTDDYCFAKADNTLRQVRMGVGCNAL